MAKTVINGLCTGTINNLQLDAGILATGTLDINTWDGQLKSGAVGFGDYKTLGATKGSISINVVPEMRNLFEGIDGARGYYKKGTVVDTWDITVKATLTEMTLKNIKHVLNAIKNTEPSSGVNKGAYNIIQPELEILESVYINNLYWIGSMVNQDKPVIIEMKNVLNMNGFNITAEDKSTGTYEVEFRPHFDLTKPNEVPLKIYLPKDKSISTLNHFEEVSIDEFSKEIKKEK